MENEILKEEITAEETAEETFEAVAENKEEKAAEEKNSVPAINKIAELFEQKKTIIIAAVLVVVLLFLAFGNGNIFAYSKAKSSFDYIDQAYNKTNTFSHDIYEAWYMGINESSKVKGSSSSYSYSYSYSSNYYKGLENLVEDMDITIEDAKKGLAFAVYGEDYENSIDLTDEDAVADLYSRHFNLYDNTFSACINIVTSAYEVTGRSAEIENLLKKAKKSMKGMSARYDDYVHYPDLKDYLTITRSFFAFCCDPEGSFEQVVDTFNNYRNESRSYYFALDYIFEK